MPVLYFRKLLLCIVFLWAMPAYGQDLSLAGVWRFATDSTDKGVAEQWFRRVLPDSIQLPGSMASNGKGDEVTLQTQWTGTIYDSSFFFRSAYAAFRQPGHVKIPFWLTPVKHYVGVAWYQKKITLPAGWTQRYVQLILERSHIQTTAWIDGVEMGRNNSLVAMHAFTLPAATAPGEHIITIRVDNRIKEVNVGPDSHSVSDHTQGNWNGIVGKIMLQALPALHITDVQVYPDVAGRKALVKVAIVNPGALAVQGKLTLQAQSFNTVQKHHPAAVTVGYKALANDTTVTEILLPMGKGMLLWDEFSPALYRLQVTLQGAGVRQQQQTQFGMREVRTEGRDILVNGRKVYLRGNLNNCEFPLTGYPPMDTDSWRRLFAQAKAFGLNHIRFHSWCPPEAAFAAADEAGFYLQPEGPTWPNHGTSLGDGRFIDQYLYDETGRIMKQYGNHASFCLFAAANEPAGRKQAGFLESYMQHWRKQDARHIYTGASVAMSWPLYPGSDYMIKSGPRGLNWDSAHPETVSDYRAKIEAFHMPYVTHEMGQWCVFPDFTEIPKYTGVMRARNFELFQGHLQAKGMGNKAKDFFTASGKLQALCYKLEIEKSLRTPDGAGFQLLGLQDFPGQGSALIGVLNAFWQEKGYISAKQWRRFCNTTVPLSRIAKFTYTNDETFESAIEIYHYGARALTNAVVEWTIRNDKGAIIKKGAFAPATIHSGKNTQLGMVRVALADVREAARLTLETTVKGTHFANDWHFWVYPKTLPASGANVHYTDTLDAAAEAVLQKGGTVFLNAAGRVVKGKEVVQYFTPVFWNTSWFKMRPPHTLGILLDSAHAAFRHFPTASYSDLQWWEIVHRAQVMHLEDFPAGFEPLVQPIDTWFMNRKLGLIIEARVGNGKVLVSSADLFTDTTRRVAARQLLYSLQQYMASPAFAPEGRVELAVLKDLFTTPSKEKWDSFTKDTPDELKPQNIHK
ncbi:hypothetical protein HNQ91_000467 [Filimonas zeae]|uniref:beta-galactosidase n=1 Tax=Filimonas zeae TaxID=1737353 RepID=A0A917IN76_9BACT|nr:sugar-binding domain-containing protein [Filimonas zeae]MDR6337445.1 hypothetical protein [Filimonas zeae]GGH58662.1 beta-glucuronidase [Filimonas zeae]